MGLTRKKGWAAGAFHDFLQARARMPFAWGSNDCALFAADAIEAITGTDIAADFRGKYTDEASAFALIQSLTGGKTVADAAAYCATKAGLVELEHPLMAQRGDLVVIPDSGRLISGVVGLNGRHVISPGEKILKTLPISDVERAWRV
jgi:hypothetical protein